MWILSFLPEWAFHLMLGIGVLGTVAGFVLGMIPFIKQYVIPLRVISLFILILAVYLESGLADNKVWEARVKEMQVKVAEAEAKSAKENVKIVQKIVRKTQIVRVRGEDIIKYVEKEVVKYDDKFAKGGQCELPKEFIKAVNDAAEEPK
jgi:Na+-transporting methylmalonyl-CoA/oxaloacetate decarboxylase gamma subunit